MFCAASASGPASGDSQRSEHPFCAHDLSFQQFRSESVSCGPRRYLIQAQQGRPSQDLSTQGGLLAPPPRQS